MSKKPFPWFNCYPTEMLDQLAGLSPQAQLVYIVTFFRIHQSGGACNDPVEALARRTGYNKRLVSDALNALVEVGKLYKDDAGFRSSYADGILQAQRAKIESASDAGRKSAERRAEAKQRTHQTGEGESVRRPAEKTKQNQTRASTTVDFSVNESSTTQTQIQNSEVEFLAPLELSLFSGSQGSDVPNGTSGAVAPVDPRTRLWREGVQTLIRITGMGPNAARRFIGQKLRDAEDSAIDVLGVIEEAERNRVIDPRAWITKALQKFGGGSFRNRQLTGYALRAHNEAEAEAEVRAVRKAAIREGIDPHVAMAEAGREQTLIRGLAKGSASAFGAVQVERLRSGELSFPPKPIRPIASTGAEHLGQLADDIRDGTTTIAKRPVPRLAPDHERLLLKYGERKRKESLEYAGRRPREKKQQ